MNRHTERGVTKDFIIKPLLSMNKLKLNNVAPKKLNTALKDLKSLIYYHSLQFDQSSKELSTNREEFDTWHLVTLGKYYGRNMFRSTMELNLLKHQDCNIPVHKRYNDIKIKIETDWQDCIEVNSYMPKMADYFMVKKLYTVLADDSKKLLSV